MQASPVHLLASSWYYSGLSCDTQTALVLYAIPLSGDVVQFIIIDKLQAAARTRTMHMPCTCQAHAMHMLCTCHAHAMHMPCTYHAHVTLQAFGFIARAADASRDFEDLDEGGTAECDSCLIAQSDTP